MQNGQICLKNLALCPPIFSVPLLFRRKKQTKPTTQTSKVLGNSYVTSWDISLANYFEYINTEPTCWFTKNRRRINN